MKMTQLLGMIGLAACLTLPAFAQTKKTLAVDEVKVTDALVADRKSDGRVNQMQRIAQALDQHLITGIVGSKKFTIVGRRDMQSFVEEQELATSGVVGKKAAQENALTGAEYKLVVYLDGFQTSTETATFDGLPRAKRRVQASAQATIYNSSTGEALEAANIQTEKFQIVDYQAGSNPNDRTDALIAEATRDLATKITARLLATLFPTRVIDVDEDIITINRGEGYFKVGDIVTINSKSKKIVDPDSGEQINIKGRPIGTLKIIDVEPNYAQAMVVTGSGFTVGSQVTLPSADAK